MMMLIETLLKKIMIGLILKTLQKFPKIRKTCMFLLRTNNNQDGIKASNQAVSLFSLLNILLVNRFMKQSPIYDT